MGPTPADTGTAGNLLPVGDSDWTLSFWIRSQSTAGNPIVMKMSPMDLTVQATSTGMQMTAGGAVLDGNFSSGPADWHHVALTYASGGQYRLYLDGVLSDLGTGSALIQTENLLIGHHASSTMWEGWLDELRIYHRRLDELDFPEVMEGTASSLTPDLKYYWKMDEEQGTKSFDILRRNKLFFCGAIFSNSRPPVRTSGMTDSDGYYRIESANYGTGITFLAEPMKQFYLHRALKFTRSESNYATLPDFSLTPKATIETWVNSAGPDGVQTLLSKRWSGSNSFQLQLTPNGTDNDIIVKLNNQAQNFGTLGLGYHHLAFTIDNQGGSTLVTAYKDGGLIGSISMPATSGDWSDPTEPWVLGARKSGASFVDYYGGLIDELAIYDTTLQASAIQEHAQNSRDPQEAGLRIYYALDEGTGNQLNNSGSVLLTETGAAFGATWTIMAPNQSTTPHEFLPATRQVTLNPSVTSVDQVDFTDRSTIPVTGFVRYQNTDCFAENVEILVNGASYNPPIFTDSTGKFSIDFEPGTTANLSPKYEDHEFSPATWNIANLTSPKAGLVFNDVTIRQARGIVAGGHCRLPILITPDQPNGTVCIVHMRSIDVCFEKNIQLGADDGDDSGLYEFGTLPPIELTVAVIEHSDPNIKTYFQNLGGQQIDLRAQQDTIIDFIYHSQPQVSIVSGLEPNIQNCPTTVIEQGTNTTIRIEVAEYYLGTPCKLDTASLHIINGLANEVKDTTMSGIFLLYGFTAGAPNPSPPFLQNIQIIATTVDGNEGSITKSALITGLVSKSSTFTTQLPETPFLVLRDPPGDGSYSYLEKDKSVCQTMSFSTEATSAFGETIIVDIGPNFTVEPVMFEATVGPSITLNTQVTKVTESSMEVCSSFSERLSTKSDGPIVGPAQYLPDQDTWVQGGDIFVGGGLNVEFGYSDKVSFDTLSCGGAVEQVISVSPRNFGTTFMYSDFYIRNYVINQLQDIADDPNTTQAKKDTCLNSIALWQKILDNNKAQINAAKFIRNISFDSGIEYEYSETSDTSSTNGSGTSTDKLFQLDFSIVGYIAGLGGGAVIHYTTENVSGKNEETSLGSSITTGYVLADDDPGDAFSVDVAMDSVYKTPVFRVVTGQSLLSMGGQYRQQGTTQPATGAWFRLHGGGPAGQRARCFPHQPW
ncbi:MAG: LamG domain-containing protein [Lewinellaceae bacterium]|nr:LamG domain-containing protein [Lewinellaceae bacterium]